MLTLIKDSSSMRLNQEELQVSLYHVLLHEIDRRIRRQISLSRSGFEFEVSKLQASSRGNGWFPFFFVYFLKLESALAYIM